MRNDKARREAHGRFRAAAYGTYELCHRAERPGVTRGVAVQEGRTHLEERDEEVSVGASPRRLRVPGEVP